MFLLSQLFFQASSPVCTELETIVMNWLGKMIGLPDDFLHIRPDSPGGGVIQVLFTCLEIGRCSGRRSTSTKFLIQILFIYLSFFFGRQQQVKPRSSVFLPEEPRPSEGTSFTAQSWRTQRLTAGWWRIAQIRHVNT